MGIGRCAELESESRQFRGRKHITARNDGCTLADVRHPRSLALVLATLSIAAGTADPVRAEGQDASTSRPSSTTARGQAARPRFQEYQIAAGTTLPIELRTRLSSNTNEVGDGIEGRLLRPLTTRDGVELVPAGAVVSGTVKVADPAGLKQRGKLAFTFHVVEHPETGSRAMIKASVLTFESEFPAKGNLFGEVRLEKGRDSSVLLLAPLLVRIPVN